MPAQIENDEVLVVSPARAKRMLDCGNTYFYDQVLPELDSYKEGKCRKITTASIKRYIAKKLAEGGAA
jgi:hypothetical protein